MRTNRPIGLISRDYIPIECIQNCEALFGSTCFSTSGGISSLPADCRRYAAQLCVARHLLKKNSREPDGFFGETAAVLIGARHVVPANAKRSVNRFKDRIQPPPECTSLRHFETDTAVTDLGLGTHQTLSHSFG